MVNNISYKKVMRGFPNISVDGHVRQPVRLQQM